MPGASTPAFGATPNVFGTGTPALQSAFGGGGLFGAQAQQQQQQVQTQMAPASFSGSCCSVQPSQPINLGCSYCRGFAQMPGLAASTCARRIVTSKHLS